MKLHSRLLVWSAVVWMTVGGVGCKRKAPAVAPPPPEVTVRKPLEKVITDYAEFTGNTQALETVDLRARVKGFLQSIEFQAGSKVQKGQLLFIIEPEPYEIGVKQAMANLETCQAQLKLNQATLDKYTEAFGKGAASTFEVLEATGDRDVSSASILAAEAALDEANLNLSYTRVAAPFDGVITRSYVDVGNLVGANDPTLLATIVNIDPIYAYFSVSERDLLEFMARMRASGAANPRDSKYPVQLGLATEQGYPHDGYFDSADNRVDPNTGTIMVRAIFPNPDRVLQAGLFVRVRMPLDSIKAMLVPDEAIMTDQAGQYVLIVDNKNIVQQRRVQPGILSEGLREIRAGLSTGDWVIVNGLLNARPGLPVRPMRGSEPAPASQPATIPAGSTTTAPSSMAVE